MKMAEIIKICKVSEYWQRTFMYISSLDSYHTMWETFYFCFLQVRKQTPRKGTWLACDFSASRNRLNKIEPRMFEYQNRLCSHQKLQVRE